MSLASTFARCVRPRRRFREVVAEQGSTAWASMRIGVAEGLQKLCMVSGGFLGFSPGGGPGRRRGPHRDTRSLYPWTGADSMGLPAVRGLARPSRFMAMIRNQGLMIFDSSGGRRPGAARSGPRLGQDQVALPQRRVASRAVKGHPGRWKRPGRNSTQDLGEYAPEGMREGVIEAFLARVVGKSGMNFQGRCRERRRRPGIGVVGKPQGQQDALAGSLGRRESGGRGRENIRKRGRAASGRAAGSMLMGSGWRHADDDARSPDGTRQERPAQKQDGREPRGRSVSSRPDKRVGVVPEPRSPKRCSG